jgi:alpha-beta hydrolase superfamily lysophospholipase
VAGPSRSATSILATLSRRAARWLTYLVGLVAAVLATIVLGFAVQTRSHPDLRPWHRIALTHEYRVGAAGAPASFDEYRALEGRLFDELRRRVLDDPAAADTHLLGRYNPGTLPSHLALDAGYNRSFELTPPSPKGAVLLVHGLSDSPYSMRALAETFFAQGYYVLSLRLPGHGTIPSSLVSVHWRDWYGAVALAAKHAAAQAGPGRPLLAGGHSTGAVLVTLYSVRALTDPSLTRPERLYLVSPAIGITPFAALTNVAAGLSFLPYFEKSDWTDVRPEFDPYKYNSFPVNAAKQIHNLTRVLQRELLAAEAAGRLADMPKVCAFQSVVDSTITAPEVVRGLLIHLPARGHELVVFDVNRREVMLGLLAPGPLEGLERLRNEPSLPFRLTVVGNRPDGTAGIALYTRDAGARETTQRDLPLEWPRGVFSLGHVALPFPPDDPVYGLDPPTGGELRFNLGAVPARGENGALLVPLGMFARLRSNPFFDLIRARVVESLATER